MKIRNNISIWLSSKRIYANKNCFFIGSYGEMRIPEMQRMGSLISFYITENIKRK